ncbi:NAD+ synthase [Planctomicrobium piriforme]|uniref:Glutamine-dependent NAD(+) synthetase n=1 Tax=Planctomicrobium piriforme TaxID=1576369 RepID=A0A1I3AT83_9PLAN|nr:NAD+ synthase [Planctomicrobium piriforme]SFH53232.1 NAD+ synthase (glutamine-hydrolysing) [Planctomicrobium piriforme]
MKIALAQLNPTVGDLAGNSRLIRQAVQQARAAGAKLLVTPELAVSGYPPKDLLHRAGFVAACQLAVQRLAELTDDEFGILVGHPGTLPSSPDLVTNSASLLHRGLVADTVHKILLPNYDVFDEKRYFVPGPAPHPIEFNGLRLGVHVCEDAWWGEPETFYHYFPGHTPDPVALLAEQGVDLFINLSASPYETGKVLRRHALIRRHVERHRRPFIFVNQTGGNDDLVFDGNSFAANAQGELVLAAAGFQPDFQIIEPAALPSTMPAPTLRREQQLLDALSLGLGDYIRKCGFTDCVLGLSGGIDSALAACIAARAVGPKHVHGLLMPSRHSSDHSLADAQALAENLGMDWAIVPIDEVHRAYEGLPQVDFDLSSQPGGLADQNLQARIRGAIVMTRSNRHNWLALATGNKSELAVGYCTLYGDMCGGFAVLSDLYKRDVYALSEYVNEAAGREIIPVNVIQKPPSAELAPNQFDQDTLPPYPLLDSILHGLIDEQRSPAELAREYPVETVLWVVKRLDRNEFKRRQMPPGIKLSQRAFGTGRRMPMAARGFTGIDDQP